MGWLVKHSLPLGSLSQPPQDGAAQKSNMAAERVKLKMFTPGVLPDLSTLVVQ